MWSGTLETGPAVVMRVSVRGAGEFLVAADSSGAGPTTTVIPKAAPDLPIVWGYRTPDGHRKVHVLATSKVVRAVLRDGATEVVAVPVSSGVVASLDVPDWNGTTDLSAQEVQLLDASGRVVSSVPFASLVSDDVTASGPGLVVFNYTAG